MDNDNSTDNAYMTLNAADMVALLTGTVTTTGDRIWEILSDFTTLSTTYSTAVALQCLAMWRYFHKEYKPYVIWLQQKQPLLTADNCTEIVEAFKQQFGDSFSVKKQPMLRPTSAETDYMFTCRGPVNYHTFNPDLRGGD